MRAPRRLAGRPPGRPILQRRLQPPSAIHRVARVAADAVEDMRSVDPVAYIRAVGLRPEDSYGFLPLDLHDTCPYLFLYRERPEYEERRIELPGPEFVQGFGPVEVMPAAKVDTELPPGGFGEGLADVIAQAQQMQQAWADQGIAGGPDEPESARIERIEKLKEMGAIDQREYDHLVSEAKGGDAGPTPGGAEAAPAAEDAPSIVAHRVYPGLRARSSTRQLDHFAPRYREQLGLCPEDVYGVYPRSTRTSSTDDSSTTEWDDFWIVYRDRPSYEQGRAAWAKDMNKKGNWPEAEIYPGVAEPGAAAFDGAKVKVEKDGWPREKMVMRKKGSDLADDLREKIGKWGYEPEDSLGFCPNFPNRSIYFAWRKA